MPLISNCSMMPAWHRLVSMSGHVEESETARKLQLYATSIYQVHSFVCQLDYYSWFDVSHSGSMGRRKYNFLCKIFPVHGLRVRISIVWMFLIVLLIILFLFRKCLNLLLPLFSRNVYLISVFAFGKFFQKKTLKTWTGKIFICVILNVVLILVFDLFISKSWSLP